MDVNIHAMAYSPVAYELDNADQWQESLGAEANSLEIYKDYIEEIVVKADIADISVGTFDGSGSPVEHCFTSLLESDYSSEQAEFDSAALELANKLNEVMHHSSNDGVLFCSQATVDGPNISSSDPEKIVSILKLNLEEESRMQLQDNREITELDWEDVFSEPEELQKGAMAPVVETAGFRLPGDVKIYQKDAVSEYFHEFLECEIRDGSLEQAKDVFRSISELKEERTGRKADADDLSTFRDYTTMTESGVVQMSDIKSAADEIVGEDVSEGELSERIGGVAMDGDKVPGVMKYTIDDVIEVKFPESEREHIEVEEGDNFISLNIRGSEYSVDALLR